MELGEQIINNIDEVLYKTAEESNMKRSNANINGNGPMGKMLQIGSESAKEFYLDKVIPKYIADAHRKGVIHIHDLDFYDTTVTCLQIELRKLFKDGFDTGHGHIREPKRIASYAALCAVVLQSSQNSFFGGQSICDFDYAMGDGVEQTFEYYLREAMSISEELTDDFNPAWMKKYAIEKTKRDTYQAMESLIHNLNSMHSRAGAQVPFTSINYGLDTRWSGRLAMQCLLEATMAGLGAGETPLFPIQVMKIKDGINLKEGDPNYDIFKLGCKCSAKRLFPNFEFIDAPFNLQYYIPGRPETEVATMGCRTRVMSDVFGYATSFGRGNLSFTTINLPRLALESKDEESFYSRLDYVFELVYEQLMHRYKLQCKLTGKELPFACDQHIYMGSENVGPDDSVEPMLKHGTLSVGFIGLAECLVALYGKHHGEDPEIQKKGLEIIGYLRKKCDEAVKRSGLNFSLLATPAEGLAGRFTRLDKERYGIIPGVTDREYYTNSFHVPVYYKISAMKKIDIEAPYHELTNAGHITYIELDGDPSNNLEAFEKIVVHMAKSGIGYGAINHPVDRDPECGYVGIIGDSCPKCGRKESTGDVGFERIRRITGYLVGSLDRWNDGKKAEERDRVKHDT